MAAKGLNSSLPFILFTLSFILRTEGSANKERLPKALGPNSALPLATPTILSFFKLFIILSIGYSPFIS